MRRSRPRGSLPVPMETYVVSVVPWSKTRGLSLTSYCHTAFCGSCSQLKVLRMIEVGRPVLLRPGRLGTTPGSYF